MSFTRLVNQIKKRCETSRAGVKQHRHDFDLDAEYLEKLWNQQNGTCPLTGHKMVLVPNSKKGQKREKTPCDASLDRLDNSKGYVKGNVRFLCYIANIALHTWTEKEFIQFCKDVVKNV